MQQMGNGTSFDQGLMVANNLFSNSARRRAVKIIIFQTDGQGSTSDAAKLRQQGVIVSITIIYLFIIYFISIF